MCLLKTHRLPKISRKPIQVYKIFELRDDRLISPYRGQVCKVGETIKSKHSWIKGIFRNEIKGEGVHAHKDIFVAQEELEFFINTFYIYLCEIPPFTPYWVGRFGDIAASKMIIKKKE